MATCLVCIVDHVGKESGQCVHYESNSHLSCK